MCTESGPLIAFAYLGVGRIYRDYCTNDGVCNFVQNNFYDIQDVLWSNHILLLQQPLSFEC